MDPQQRPDRNLAMDLMRATEAAALAGGRWMGRGDKNTADGAAVEAMRVVLNSVSMEGVVVIGEGEKDEAPMLFNGEQIGDGSPPSMDIAVDPIDGTRLTALGLGGAISVIAMSERGTMFDPGPCVYMEKIAAGPAAADVIDINAPVTANLEAVAKALGEKVSDVTAVILDRDRHADIIAECRAAGARIRLIPDGDVAGAISVAWRNSGNDILFGIGGTPEGVIAACALQCLGGTIQGRLWPRDDGERRAALDAGFDVEQGAHHRRPRLRQRRLLRRDRHHRRRAVARRALLGRWRRHAEPGDALEVRNDPHHRGPAPMDEAEPVRRRPLHQLRHVLQLHVDNPGVHRIYRVTEVQALAPTGLERASADSGHRLEGCGSALLGRIAESSSARTDEVQRAVAVPPQVPAALVDESMMERAQQHTVLRIGRTSAHVVREVVHMREPFIRTPGEPANASVTVLDRASKRERNRALAPPHYVLVTAAHVDPHARVAHHSLHERRHFLLGQFVVVDMYDHFGWHSV